MRRKTVHRNSALAIAVLCIMASGCASVPDVTVPYHTAKAVLKVSAVQTLGCDADKRPFAVNSLAVTPVYSATGKPYDFQFQALDGTFSDSNTTIGLTEDDRLKSINATTTGEGENIAKATIALGSAIASAAALMAAREPLSEEQIKKLGLPPSKAKAAGPLPFCKFIADGKNNVVSLSYAVTVDDLGKLPATMPLAATAEYRAQLDSLSKHPGFDASLTQFSVTIDAGPVSTPPQFATTEAPADWCDSQQGNRPAKWTDDDTVPLCLNNTQTLTVKISGGGMEETQPYRTTVRVPAGLYVLPVPKSKLFGNQTFALTLADSGAVTSITYAKSAGIAGALNVAAGAVSASAPASATDQAAQLKAEADRIAQTQRIARCRANPATCT